MAQRLLTAEVKIDQKAIMKLMGKPLNKFIDRFNKKAPAMFKAAAIETLKKDPLFKGGQYWKAIEFMKVENRPLGAAKAGSGFTFRIQNKVLLIRIILTDGKIEQVLGQDGFWKFKTLTTGKWVSKVKAGVTTPIRVSGSNTRAKPGYKHSRTYDNKVESNNKDGVYFVYSSTGYTRRGTTKKSTWKKDAETLALKNIVQKLGAI